MIHLVKLLYLKSDNSRCKSVLSVVNCVVSINLIYGLGALIKPEVLLENVIQTVFSFCFLTL